MVEQLYIKVHHLSLNPGPLSCNTGPVETPLQHCDSSSTVKSLTSLCLTLIHLLNIKEHVQAGIQFYKHKMMVYVLVEYYI